ncbi:MAG: TonB-dependent receptor [Pseudoxanthomonas sp.]
MNRTNLLNPWCKRTSMSVALTAILAGTAVAAPAAEPAAQDDSDSKPTKEKLKTVDLDEIKVTAERRESTVQKTGASLSVVLPEDLKRNGKSTLPAILSGIPGVSYSAGGSASAGAKTEISDNPGAAVTIRGLIADKAAASNTPAPVTASYTDGIYGGVGGDYDLVRVEVLRGPQGTLYGRNATGGVINMITRDPELDYLGGDVLAELGDYGVQHYSAAVNLPLAPTLAARISANSYQQDGYIDADGGWFKRDSARIKLLYQPTDTFSVLFGAAMQKQVAHTGGKSYIQTGGADGPITEKISDVASKKDKFNQLWARFNWHIGDYDLTYIPAYKNWKESGWTVGGTQTNFSSTPHDVFRTHEIRLASSDSERFNWIVGAFSFHNDVTATTTARWVNSQALNFDQEISKDINSLGVFAEGTYRFTPTTRLSVGLRHDKNQVETKGWYTANLSTNTTGSPYDDDFAAPEILETMWLSGDQTKRSYENITFKVRLEKDLTPTSMFYALVATGFQPGDIAVTTGTNGPVALPYDQQKLTSYELGIKNDLFDRRLRLNADVFYYDYTGYQQTANISTTSAPSYIVVNAPATMVGAELEAQWRVTPHDSISASYSHVRAMFHDQSDIFKAANVGDRIPGISPTMAQLGYDHEFDLGNGSALNFHLEGRYQAKTPLSISAAKYTSFYLDWIRQNDTRLVNTSLTWTSPTGQYSISGYVHNVLDRVTRSIGSSFSGTGANTTSTFSFSDPRTYGVVLQAHF